MRGKPCECRLQQQNIRITPADAGKTPTDTAGSIVNRDHPRGCGENVEDGKWGRKSQGSPPRMRGKLLMSGCRLTTVRITPADAGKTLSATNVAFLQ